MATNVIENLGKLKRCVEISIPKEIVQKEIDLRIKKLAKTVRISGFRLGRVPINIIDNRYYNQVKEEVIDEKIRQEFLEISRSENIHVAGQPDFTLKQEITDTYDSYTFNATFEVYPDVKIGDLTTAEIECYTTIIGPDEIDKTLDILRKQYAQYKTRVEKEDCLSDIGAQNSDRLTVNFNCNIKSNLLQANIPKIKNFVFILGERKILPELEKAAIGMKVGEVSKFEVKLPDDYHDKYISGKTINLAMTIKKIESQCLPKIDKDFAKLLGIKNGDLMEMRNHIKDGLEYEAKRRIRSILKNRALDTLLKISELHIPNVLIEQEKQRLIKIARQNLVKHGALNVKDIEIPVGIFSNQAKRRVKLAIVVSEFVKLNNLEARPEQLREQVNELIKKYKDKRKAARLFYSNKQRLSEIEALIIEDNVVDLLLSKAKVTYKKISFEMLASASEQDKVLL
ncbi:MAG: trigger factor [Burkholderia sp.]|nr:trigger factor [Burkholderia sp.]